MDKLIAAIAKGACEAKTKKTKKKKKTLKSDDSSGTSSDAEVGSESSSASSESAWHKSKKDKGRKRRRASSGSDSDEKARKTSKAKKDDTSSESAQKAKKNTHKKDKDEKKADKKDKDEKEQKQKDNKSNRGLRLSSLSPARGKGAATGTVHTDEEEAALTTMPHGDVQALTAAVDNVMNGLGEKADTRFPTRTLLATTSSMTQNVLDCSPILKVKLASMKDEDTSPQLMRANSCRSSKAQGMSCRSFTKAPVPMEGHPPQSDQQLAMPSVSLGPPSRRRDCALS